MGDVDCPCFRNRIGRDHMRKSAQRMDRRAERVAGFFEPCRTLTGWDRPAADAKRSDGHLASVSIRHTIRTTIFRIPLAAHALRPSPYQIERPEPPSRPAAADALSASLVISIAAIFILPTEKRTPRAATPVQLG